MHKFAILQSTERMYGHYYWTKIKVCVTKIMVPAMFSSASILKIPYLR